MTSKRKRLRNVYMTDSRWLNEYDQNFWRWPIKSHQQTLTLTWNLINITTTTNIIVWIWPKLIFVGVNFFGQILTVFWSYEILFLGFLKEDLFYFFLNNFSSFLIFHISLSNCVILGWYTFAQGMKHSSVLPWQVLYFKEDNLDWIV